MKLRVQILCRTARPISAALLCLAFVSHAATTPTNATSTTAAGSPATPAATLVETEIPQSVFVVPTSASEGRDPFFPRTTRLSAGTRIASGVKTNPQPSFVVELALKGISGTRERPLAIINNQTFAAGEENDVVTGTRRVRIRCVEINAPAETVIIQIGNERRELRLKQNK
ncbi:MAG: hypothetical protein DME26_17085 [Verrucomicrobia bacterium]|nr:MAG: hypothetical protein DME26_17085 [Verrucomicrobiota bacterium]